MIYKECWRAAEKYDVDVAIALRDSRDYALAQVIRRELGGAWPELREKEQEAQKLGSLAKDARLVPFMGAGISLSAGAPTWNGLIEKTCLRRGHRRFAHALQKMANSIPEGARSGAVWNVVSGMLTELGWQTESSRSSWRAVPKGLK